MSKEVVIICPHGTGDVIQGIQCAHFSGKERTKILVCSRYEVFEPIKHLFGSQFDIEQGDPAWGEDNFFLRDSGPASFLKSKYKEVYYVVPDLLYNNEYAFDCKKYGKSPHVINSTRLLTHLRVPEDIIYLALNSSTPEYQLGDRIPSLIREISAKNPTKTVWFDSVTKWAGKEIDNGDLSNMPENVVINKDIPFIQAIENLKCAEYVLTVDCGMFHIANQLGIPLTLLDTRLNNNGIKWWPRWRNFGLDHSIPQETENEPISNLIYNNIHCIQTTLIPRSIVLSNPSAPWEQALFLKKL